jgi:hypothetical protein
MFPIGSCCVAKKAPVDYGCGGQLDTISAKLNGNKIKRQKH